MTRETPHRRFGWRSVLAMNLAVWAMLAFTAWLEIIWIRPNEGFQMIGLFLGICFTLVSVLSLFWKE